VGKLVEFRAIYMDTDGDRPAQGHPQLWIDRNDDGDYNDSNEKISMTESGSGNYKTGKEYYLEILVEKGTHKYRAYAKDSKGHEATGEATSDDTEISVASVQVQASQDTLVYILIVVIVVAAVVCFFAGRMVGGKKSKPPVKPEGETEEVTAAPPEYQDQPPPPQYYQEQPASPPPQEPPPAPQPQQAPPAPPSPPQKPGAKQQ
jgi:hypothetical protein